MKKGVLLAALIAVVAVITATVYTASAQTTVYVPMVPKAEPTKVQPTWTNPGLYLSGQLGGYGPADDEYDDEYQPQNGVAGNLIFGYRVNPYAAVQAEIGYYDSSGQAGFEFNALPVMGVLRLGIPLFGFDVYATGGLGAVFYKSEDFKGNQDQVAVGALLGIGTNYYINEHLFVGAEARYMMSEVDEAPNDGIMLLGQVGWKL